MPASAGAGSSGSRSQTMSAAVRSASVAVMGRKLLRRSARYRSSLWCITSRRAVKPARSKKFLAWRWPGSAAASTPDAAGARAERDEPLDEQLPDPDRPGLGLHVDLARSRRAACRRAAPRSRRCRTRRRARRACRRPSPRRRASRSEASVSLERLGTRLARRPQRAAALVAQLGAELARELDDAREVGVGRDARVLHGSAYAEIWSILPRIVRRLRCAPRTRARRRARRRESPRAAPRPATPTARRSPGSAARRRADAPLRASAGRAVGRRRRWLAVGDRTGACGGSAPVAGVPAAAPGVGRASAAGSSRRRSTPRNVCARWRALSTSRSTRWRTIGTPNVDRDLADALRGGRALLHLRLAAVDLGAAARDEHVDERRAPCP